VLHIIKSVGTDVCHVTQCGPRLIEMINSMTKLEDAVMEAPSMAATRYNAYSAPSFKHNIKYWPVMSSRHKKMVEAYSWITINRMRDGVQAYEDTCIGCRDTRTNIVDNLNYVFMK
jgi:hypothetical protein